MSDPRVLAALAENLRCRARLGLHLVDSTPDAARRLSLLLGGRGAAPAATEGPAAPSADLPAPPLDPQPGQMDLEAVRRAMGECTRCALHEGRDRIVFGQGPQNARLMLIGEAPGQQEDRRGVPFVGPAGQLLDRMLAAVGLARGQVYITNIVKCRPPGNRDPKPEEAAACRGFLEAQVAAVDPAVICTLGRPASQAVLGSDAPISALRGNWRQALGHKVLPTFHPAYLLRNPAAKAQAYQDLKALALALRES